MHKKKITVLTFKNKKEQPIHILELFSYFRSPWSIDITVSCSFVFRLFHIFKTSSRYSVRSSIYFWYSSLPFPCWELIQLSSVNFISFCIFNKCSKNSPTSSGGEMNCTSGHICSKNPYSTKETLVLYPLM